MGTGVITIVGLKTAPVEHGATLGMLRDRIYKGLGDEEKVVAHPVQVEGLLNDAYFDLCARLNLNQGTSRGLTSQNGKVELPPDFVKLVDVTIGGKHPTAADTAAFKSWKDSGNRPGSTIFRIVGDEIETYPKDDTVNVEYELRYVKVPKRLVDDKDLFVSLPIILEPKVVAYVNAHIMWLVGHTNSGDRFMKNYLDGLPTK